MTAPRREQRTASFEASQDEPSSSDFVASWAEPHADAIEPPRSDLESADMPVDLFETVAVRAEAQRASLGSEPDRSSIELEPERIVTPDKPSLA